MLYIAIKMAKPIESTPRLNAEESVRFIKKMIEVENRPISKAEKRLAKQIKKDFKDYL